MYIILASTSRALKVGFHQPSREQLQIWKLRKCFGSSGYWCGLNLFPRVKYKSRNWSYCQSVSVRNKVEFCQVKKKSQSKLALSHSGFPWVLTECHIPSIPTHKSFRIPGFSLLPAFIPESHLIISLTTSLRPEREGKHSLCYSSPLGRRHLAISCLFFDIKGQSLCKTCLMFRSWIHLALLPEWDKL